MSTGLLFGIVGVALLPVAWLMRNERLPRNFLVGMRTNATMASDAAWKVSHRASSWSVALAGLLLLGAGLWLLIGDLSADTGRNVTTGTTLAVLLIVVLGGFQAHHVAKGRVGDGSRKSEPDETVHLRSRRRRDAPELLATVALALLGLAAWPFAPHELPMHWGFEGFGNFASSWVALIAWPCSCAAVAAYVTFRSRRRESPATRDCARLMLVLSGTDLLLQLTFVAL